MSAKLFEFAVIAHPTETEEEDGKQSELIVSPTTVLAPTEQSAVMLAGRAIPEAWLGKLDRVEVVVRPF